MPARGPVRPGRVKVTWIKLPKAAQAVAAEALRRQEKLPKSKRGGLSRSEAGKQGITSGRARAASIARGELQPAEDLRDFFNRFRSTFERSADKAWEDSKIQQAWDLWGGEPAREAVLRQLAASNPSAARAHLLAWNPDFSSSPEKDQAEAYVQKMEAYAAQWEDIEDQFPDLDEAEEEAVWAYEDATGLAFLGGGAYRLVFDLGDGNVIKLPIFHSGRDSNFQECQLWNQRGSKIEPMELRRLTRKWLSPVLACDPAGEWLVMPKLELVDPSDLPDLRWGSPAAQDLSALGVTDAGQFRNWGRLPSGEVVLLDYGSTL